ncbi:MAG: hypothetical protein LBB76_03360 [Azoarcus sp.]|nr:hypothetical protein [Azoarcus sp.]
MSKRQKVTPLLFAGLISKKDKQSSPFVGVKARSPHCQMGFALGLHGLKPGFAWFQTQNKPQTGKKLGLFFDDP